MIEMQNSLFVGIYVGTKPFISERFIFEFKISSQFRLYLTQKLENRALLIL